jgi:preprotein translocase subunit SecA
MGFFNKIMQNIFGSKYDKDVAAIKPILQKINQVYPTLQNLDNDALRYKTVEFRQRIAKYLSAIDEEMQSFKQTVEDNPEMDPNQKEEYYKAIDQLQTARDQRLEEILNEILPEAFAVVKEAARRFSENTELVATATDLDRDLATRFPHIVINDSTVTYSSTWKAAGNDVTWNMQHYDVQLIGGIVLHQGKIAEMGTGEGKTLVSTLPAYLNGLSGQGVHIVTVNDYLAKRDSEWMGTLHQFLGLTVDCIDKYRPNSNERRNAYLADIIYGTNNEFGFDYLRDNMVRTPAELVQRKHHYAMVDEVDSVLIDDARTPLIISGPADRGEEQEFEALKPRIESLVNKQQELVREFLNEAKKQIEAGNADEKTGGLALLRANRGMPKYKPLIKYLSETGKKSILANAENYYMQEQNKRMPQVDAELLFVIDEKSNSVDLTEKGIHAITKSGEDPNFFILPDIGSAVARIERSNMSPEEKSQAKTKVMQDFEVKADRVHSIQQLLKAYTLFEKDVEYIIQENKIMLVDESTGRVLEGRRYSDGLHQAIEAKESVQIEAATQTYATITLQNYFRMYHKLAGMTGTAETEAGEFWEIYKLDVVVIPTNRPIARKDQEDLVYKTVREKYNAVVNEIEQLINAGRPVLVGTTSVENSEILHRLLERKGIKHNVLNAKHHAREAEIVAEAGQSGAVTIATNMAGRGTDIKLGAGVKEAGGLAIIGTERHDSRRVDRQLRGRAGRQGDPGSSQFYVSLEDNLMRLFGSDRVSGVMDRLGHQDGDVIQHSMISSSIERAQKKVEENNFGTRKRLLDYDGVMNAQRKVVYAKRRHALFGERLTLDLYNSFHDICSDVALMFAGDNSKDAHENFKLEVFKYFSLDTNITPTELLRNKPEPIANKLYDEVITHYHLRCEKIAEAILPNIHKVLEEQGHIYERMIIPFTDTRRIIQIIVNMRQAIDTNGKPVIKELEKAVSLAFIDEMWKDQLRRMDDLKQSVQGAVWEQKDPLLIYKKESFGIFTEMIGSLNRDIAAFLFGCGIFIEQVPQEEQQRRLEQQQKAEERERAKMRITRDEDDDPSNDNTPGVDEAEVRAVQEQERRRVLIEAAMRHKQMADQKVGRNDPCPCGSGKKFKHCHGK